MLKHEQGADAGGACGSSRRRGDKDEIQIRRSLDSPAVWAMPMVWAAGLARSVVQIASLDLPSISAPPRPFFPSVASQTPARLLSSPQSRCNKLVSAACDREIARTSLVLPSLASPSSILSGSRAAICRCRPLLAARASRARSCSTKHSRIAGPVIQVQQAATSRTPSRTGTVGCSRFARQ